MLERWCIRKDKIEKVAMKAWKSKEVVPDHKKNKNHPKSDYRMFSGYVFVFENGVLITVYSVGSTQ